MTETYYKAVRPDGTDFRTGTVRWLPPVGDPMPGGDIAALIQVCVLRGSKRFRLVRELPRGRGARRKVTFMVRRILLKVKVKRLHAKCSAILPAWLFVCIGLLAWIDH